MQQFNCVKYAKEYLLKNTMENNISNIATRKKRAEFEKQFDTIMVTKWQCLEDHGAPLITMPNVPKPLHAINPRIIMGQDKWDNLRMQCYLDSKYKCEICDRKLDDKNIQLHELYSYNHTNGVAKFERYISVCKLCHNGIHSGRAASLFRNHNPIFTKKYMLEIAENAFKLVYEYNEEHHAELRLFKTYLEWLRLDELRDELLELMTKYDVKIYRWPRSVGKWERWHLEWNGQKYYTPYHNGHEWRADMREKNKSDYLRHLDLRNP